MESKKRQKTSIWRYNLQNTYGTIVNRNNIDVVTEDKELRKKR